MDEHLNYDTNFNSRDEYNLTWACMADYVEEITDKRKTWRPRKFTSMEKMSCPANLRCIETRWRRTRVVL
jgi:hypothetical protein